MSLKRTNTSTELCQPLCASVGHTFVTLSVWRCDHHGALTGVLTTYIEGADALTEVVSKDWVGGPFTADLDINVLLDLVTNALHGLIAPTPIPGVLG